ncbi:MAG: NTPase [candidate division WOR-3 bacterium]|nr:MAG: NTPase [candidate division WOR-3 bacterium]
MKNVLLSGPPRIGKTTIIHKIINKMNKECAGFYTEEMRKSGQRVGFKLVSLANESCIMSHKRIKSRYRVGTYRVDIACVEKIGVAAIRRGIEKSNIIVIDEIGKMELFSKEFQDIVLKALDAPLPVLATILSRPHTFCDTIKDRYDVEIIEVTHANRDSLPDIIVKKLAQ